MCAAPGRCGEKTELFQAASAAFSEGSGNRPGLKVALLEQGYDVKDINITVGTNYEATGEAMAAGGGH